MDKNEQPDKNKILTTLKTSLEKLLKEVESLGGWDAPNAAKLDALNQRRHSFASDLIDLGQ